MRFHAHRHSPPHLPALLCLQTTTEQLVQANPSVAEGVLSPGTVVFIPP